MADTQFIDALEKTLMQPELDLSYLTPDEQFKRIVSKACAAPGAVVPVEDLLERLKLSKESGKPLTVKFGIDPTGPDIHIGHAVSLINLRLFQRMGHKIVLVIGDFTGMIGDPSGRLDARPSLTAEEVRQNMATYEQQASTIIDLHNPTIERHYNTEWMNRLGMRQWVDLTKRISASSLLQREDFRTRLAEGRGFSIAELEYAIFMGYDSVVLNPDIEIGGVDQYLNMHMCREMMAGSGQKPEIIISYNLLAGTTGERDEAGRLIKMSKSRGNYIAVSCPPSDMYGKVMSVPDEIMWVWYRELTEISSDELDRLKKSVESGEIHPKVAKQLLARVVVATFNHFNSGTAIAAEKDFDSKFGKQAVLVPDSTETVRVLSKEILIDTLTEITGRSKGDIRRLIQQGGIRILRDGHYSPLTLDELGSAAECFSGCVIKIGKLNYYRILKELE